MSGGGIGWIWMSGIATSATSRARSRARSPRRRSATISSESSGLVGFADEVADTEGESPSAPPVERRDRPTVGVSGCRQRDLAVRAQFAQSPRAAAPAARPSRRSADGGWRQPGHDRRSRTAGDRAQGTGPRTARPAAPRPDTRSVYSTRSITSDVFGSAPAERLFPWHGARADRDGSRYSRFVSGSATDTLDRETPRGRSARRTWVPRTKPATESTVEYSGVDAVGCDRVCVRCVSDQADVEVVAPHARAACRQSASPATVSPS